MCACGYLARSAANSGVVQTRSPMLSRRITRMRRYLALVDYHFDFMHLDRAYATTVTRATTIDATKLRRVLLIMPYWLGDAVMVSPLFTALKRHIPEAEIDALIADNLAELVEHDPAISRVHHIGQAWRRSGVLKTLAPRLRLLRELRRRRYDVLIQPSDGSWGAALALLLRIPYAVGVSASAHRQPVKRFFWRHAFSHQHDVMPGHAVQNNLALLGSLGVHAPQEPMTVVPGESAAAAIARRLQALDLSDFVLLAPTSSKSGTSRETDFGLSADQCRELLVQLTKRGERVIVTSAPVKQEMDLVGSATAGLDAIDLSGQLGLGELAALVGKAKCAICMDSGTMHLAAAMRTPVVAIFIKGNPIRTGPWQVKHRVVRSADQVIEAMRAIME